MSHKPLVHVASLVIRYSLPLRLYQLLMAESQQLAHVSDNCLDCHLLPYYDLRTYGRSLYAMARIYRVYLAVQPVIQRPLYLVRNPRTDIQTQSY